MLRPVFALLRSPLAASAWPPGSARSTRVRARRDAIVRNTQWPTAIESFSSMAFRRTGVDQSADLATLQLSAAAATGSADIVGVDPRAAAAAHPLALIERLISNLLDNSFSRPRAGRAAHRGRGAGLSSRSSIRCGVPRSMREQLMRPLPAATRAQTPVPCCMAIVGGWWRALAARWLERREAGRGALDCPGA